ncbi:TAXI family TRAP transporter solute-binding subunit [Thiocapsa imhoffii]|nr:TAXI family TRAP transporter solute-binding subunit [Thiocapsa imhoffii]
MKRMLLILLVLTLTACEHGPDATQIESDLDARLAETFGDTALTLQQVRRLGSANDANAPQGETRRIVYFNAQLRVDRDQNFGAWDAPGVANLVSLLGTGPRGLTGIQAGGNVRGDILGARGSLIYRESAHGWEPVVPQGFSAPRLPTTGEGAEMAQDEQLAAAISTALNLSPGGTSVAARRIIHDEVARSLGNIRGRISRLEHGFPLASGPDQGQYARFANAWSVNLMDSGVKLQPLLTSGGVENLMLLRDDLTVLALSQSDVVYEAFVGLGAFAEDGPNHGLRALASLFPEPLHVVVRNASDLHRFADLKGRRISIGPPGSASHQTARAVLAAYGLGPDDLRNAADLTLAEGLRALRDGRIDALLQVIGEPADQIRAAAETLDLRFLPLDEDAIERLMASRPGIFAHRLRPGTYPKQRNAIATIAVSAMLLADTSLTDREAAFFIRQLFDPANRWLTLGSIQGTQLSLDHATRGLMIPLHAGAEEALMDLGDSEP